jgi:hypothetical protein
MSRAPDRSVNVGKRGARKDVVAKKAAAMMRAIERETERVAREAREVPRG